MKSITNKKKNSTIGHISGNGYHNIDLLRQFANSLIYDSKNNTINGVPVHELETRLEASSLPPGIKGCCHICKPKQLFNTLFDLNEHIRDKHAIFKH